VGIWSTVQKNATFTFALAFYFTEGWYIAMFAQVNNNKVQHLKRPFQSIQGR
jgi:hypothetical protein